MAGILGQWSPREGIWEQQGKGKVGIVLWLCVRDLVSTSGTGSWRCEPAGPSMGLTGLFCVASCGLGNKTNIYQILATVWGSMLLEFFQNCYKSKTHINRKLNVAIKFCEIFDERKNFITDETPRRKMRWGGCQKVPNGLDVSPCATGSRVLPWLSGSPACATLVWNWWHTSSSFDIN